MNAQRFEALLAHQGPLVHVDHSHRAPAPTGEDCGFWDFACWKRQAVVRDRIRDRIVTMGLAEEGEPWTHTISVRAGAVREFLKTRPYKAEKVRWISDDPRQPVYKFDVKFLIDDESNVRYIILPSGYSAFDDGVSAGGAYKWSEDQDNEYLYAPNEKLRYVLQTAANKLFEMHSQ